ncbi:MAG: hypothetical protein KDD11_04395 [Acidobacteria bacterium]|nr:hypothetical protein [Acidobacteriota bacterium]
MKPSRLVASTVVLGVLLALVTPSADAGDTPIQTIPFESIPTDTSLVGGPDITLDGPTVVTQDLSVQGEVESVTGGVRFPDGTLQLTAATGVCGSNERAGLYDNRIPAVTPPEPYSEVCFKGGSVQSDVHTISESTAGGSCVPGDLGWIIERDERTAAAWDAARVECLLIGMRLPEPFEWRISCVDAATFGLNDMTGNWEWASNEAEPIISSNGTYGIATAAFGNAGCANAGHSWVGNSVNNNEVRAFRCVL